MSHLSRRFLLSVLAVIRKLIWPDLLLNDRVASLWRNFAVLNLVVRALLTCTCTCSVWSCTVWTCYNSSVYEPLQVAFAQCPVLNVAQTLIATCLIGLSTARGYPVHRVIYGPSA